MLARAIGRHVASAMLRRSCCGGGSAAAAAAAPSTTLRSVVAAAAAATPLPRPSSLQLRPRLSRAVHVSASTSAEGGSSESSLVARVGADMKAAMKAKDAPRLSAIRFLSAALKQREIELRASGGALSDGEAVATIQKLAKQRRDSIESYRQGGRDDLVAKEEAELALLEAYLPAPLTPAELEAIVKEAVAAVGATSPKQMGAVMKAVQAKAGGRADNKAVSALVKAALGG